jgi:hypothetical protein
LLNAACEAFTQGLQLTAFSSAAIVLGVAIVAAVLLRHIHPSSKTTEAEAATVVVEESG